MSTDSSLSISPRRNSFRAFLHNLNPKNRPERGGTLRPELHNDTYVSSASQPQSPPFFIPQHHTIRRRPVPPPATTYKPPIPSMIPPSPIRIHISRPKDSSITATSRSERAYRSKVQRSFRQSEDFLGVQGVNPRTGRRDASLSEDTSLTAGTKLSLGSLGSLDVEFREVVEQRRREVREAREGYLRAKERLKGCWEVLRRVKEDRGGRGNRDGNRGGRGNSDGKKRVSKGKREAKWMLSETGWNSVLSPELTPVQTFAREDIKSDYFGEGAMARTMSVISENAGVGMGTRSTNVSTIAVVGEKTRMIEWEGIGRRSRRHRRSFK